MRHQSRQLTCPSFANGVSFAAAPCTHFIGFLSVVVASKLLPTSNFYPIVTISDRTAFLEGNSLEFLFVLSAVMTRLRKTYTLAWMLVVRAIGRADTFETIAELFFCAVLGLFNAQAYFVIQSKKFYSPCCLRWNTRITTNEIRDFSRYSRRYMKSCTTARESLTTLRWGYCFQVDRFSKKLFFADPYPVQMQFIDRGASVNRNYGPSN